MSEKKQKYIIVGNGFDLNLGIESSYNHFVEELLKVNKLRSPSDIYSFNSLLIQRFNGNDLNWSDFETEFENQVFSIDASNVEATKKQYEIAKLNADIQALEYEFYNYLIDTYEKWKSKTLGDLNPKEIVNPLYHSIFRDANVLTFNYTSTLQDLKLFEQCNNVFQLHGNLDKNNLIFGGGIVSHPSARNLTTPGATLNDKLVRIKQDPTLLFERERLSKTIRDDDTFDLYILGHSIYGSDLGFLKRFLLQAEKIYLFYFENDYQDKFQHLIKNFESKVIEKIVLVPFLNVIERDENSFMKINQVADGGYLQMIEEVFRVPFPRNDEFSEFWLANDFYSLEKMTNLVAKDPTVAEYFDWFFLHFELDESNEFVPSIPIHFENLGDQVLSNSLLVKDLPKRLLQRSKRITVRNCDFSFDMLWNCISGGECESLVLERNNISVDLNDELNLGLLTKIKKVNINNNNFFADESYYPVDNFKISTPSSVANRQLYEIHCLGNTFKGNECVDVSLYRYSEFANVIELPFLDVDYEYPKLTFKNVEQLNIPGASEDFINRLKEEKK